MSFFPALLLLTVRFFFRFFLFDCNFYLINIFLRKHSISHACPEPKARTQRGSERSELQVSETVKSLFISPNVVRIEF